MLFSVVTLAFAVDVPVDADIAGTYIPVDANVVTAAFSVDEIQICDGACTVEWQLPMDPATEFTVLVKVSGGDFNAADFDLNIVSKNAVDAWDYVALEHLDGNSESSNGCTLDSGVYCIKVTANSWTTKFTKDNADVTAIAYSAARGSTDSNTSEYAIAVNEIHAFSSDTNSGSYDGFPEDVGIALITNVLNNYILLENTGNESLGLYAKCEDLNKGATVIPRENEKFNVENVYGEATTCSWELLTAGLVRGAYPTNGTNTSYWWLDFPALLPVGAYEGTVTFTEEAPV